MLRTMKPRIARRHGAAHFVKTAMLSALVGAVVWAATSATMVHTTSAGSSGDSVRPIWAFDWAGACMPACKFLCLAAALAHAEGAACIIGRCAPLPRSHRRLASAGSSLAVATCGAATAATEAHTDV